MKIFCFIISVLSLFLIGCSSTYRVSDFSSKDKFYEHFNKSASDKSLKIILCNDSTINVDNGTSISNDSLIFAVPILKEEKISRDNIEELVYNSYDINIINTVILKNGKLITSNNIQLLSDSSVAFWDYVTTNEYLSLNNVKKISYKNHWLGLPVPLISGTLLGVGLGILFVEVNDTFSSGSSGSQSGSGANMQSSSNSQDGTDEYAFLGLSTIGILGGGLLGWINGWTYTYEFVP